MANPWFSHIYKVLFAIVRGSGDQNRVFGNGPIQPTTSFTIAPSDNPWKTMKSKQAFSSFLFNILFKQYSLILFSPSITPLRSSPPPTHSTLPLSKQKQPPSNEMKQDKKCQSKTKFKKLTRKKTQTTTTNVEFNCVGRLLLSTGLSQSVIGMLRDTPPEKTDSLFSQGGIPHPTFPFQCSILSGFLNLCMSCACCHSLCEFLCISVLLCLEDTTSLKSSTTSGSQNLSFFSSTQISEPWGWGRMLDEDIP